MKTYISLVCFFLLPCLTFGQNLGLGVVNFPNSGKTEAQTAFSKGLLLLHSFEFEDAAEAFQEAQKIDPKFAMAYWGEAMTYNHPVWFEQEKDKGLNALKNLAPDAKSQLAAAKTAKEKDWLSAIHVLYGPLSKEENDRAYAEKMALLYQKYPADADVASFYALGLMGTCHNGRVMEVYKKAGEIVSKVYAANPEHPGVLHYLIHAYDDPYNAEKALDAAINYSRIAAEAAHALHMPSHIFVAKGMWEQVIKNNIDSWNAAESRRIRKNLDFQARGYHAFHWMQYGLLQTGDFKAAKTLLDSMARDTKTLPSKRLRQHLAHLQSTYIIESEDWKSDALDIKVDYTLLSSVDKASNKFARAYASIKRGDLDQAKELYEQMVKERIDGEPIVLDKDMTVCHAVGGELYDQMELESKIAAVIEAELRAMILYAENNKVEAFKMLKLATEAELQLPMAYGPPDIVKPSYELLGELLLKEGDAKKAKEMFELALLRAPNRTLSKKGLVKSIAMM
jgi:tetratricopeptide (TPR) repeat protein